MNKHGRGRISGKPIDEKILILSTSRLRPAATTLEEARRDILLRRISPERLEKPGDH